MSARSDILARIRAATVDAAAVDVPRHYRQRGAGAAGASHAPRHYRQRGADAGSPELIDRFAERVADYRADVHRCPSGEVAATIAEILSRRSRRGTVVPAGFPVAWVHAGVDAIDVIDGDTVTQLELDRTDGTMSLCAV